MFSLGSIPLIPYGPKSDLAWHIEPGVDPKQYWVCPPKGMQRYSHAQPVLCISLTYTILIIVHMIYYYILKSYYENRY